MIASLAGVGLLTQVVGVADWIPATLKAFRKIGVPTRKFSDFVLAAFKKSIKSGKLDGTLKIAFQHTAGLVDRMGIDRTATVLKQVDTPDDLRTIAKFSKKSADTAEAEYFMIKNGGAQGMEVMKRFGDTKLGVKAIELAAKKGQQGIKWLRPGGAEYRYLIRTRVMARVIKNLHLRRPQQLVIEAARKYSGLKEVLWVITVLAAFAGGFACIQAGRKAKRIGKCGADSSLPKTDRLPQTSEGVRA